MPSYSIDGSAVQEMGGRVTYDEYRYRQTDAVLQPKRPRSARSAAWTGEVLRVTCHDCNTIGRIFRRYLLKNLTEIRKTAEDGLWLYVYCPWARHLIRSEPLQVHPLELFSLDRASGTKGGDSEIHASSSSSAEEGRKLPQGSHDQRPVREGQDRQG